MSFERIDRLLVPLFTVKSDDKRTREIERILLQTRPFVENAIHRYSSSEWSLTDADADEIRAIVSFRLLRRLEALVEDAAASPIFNLDDYVTRLTYNGINDYLRTRFPVRARLKSRIRYFLSRHPAFALWATHRGSAVGLAEWRNRTDVLTEIDFATLDLEPDVLDEEDPRQALHLMFEKVGGPVRLDAVVDVLMQLWRGDASRPQIASEVESAAAEQEMRDFVRSLWGEVRLLPPRQRAALLLNLRGPEGVDAVSLLMTTGAATIADIAAALEMTTGELTELWSQLPLSDNEIAARLSVSRQAVINLRKSARERLARRMRTRPSGSRV